MGRWVIGTSANVASSACHAASASPAAAQVSRARLRVVVRSAATSRRRDLTGFANLSGLRRDVAPAASRPANRRRRVSGRDLAQRARAWPRPGRGPLARKLPRAVRSASVSSRPQPGSRRLFSLRLRSAACAPVDDPNPAEDSRGWQSPGRSRWVRWPDGFPDSRLQPVACRTPPDRLKPPLQAAEPAS